MLRQFLSDQRGNIALIFAGSLMAISGAVGLSVDYARVLSDQQQAQNRLDASLLATASQYQEHGKRSLSIRAGKKHFTASLPNANSKKIKIKISNKEVTGEYTGTTDHYFLPIIGQKTSTWKVEANIKYAQTLVTDFALAIDVSASMDNHDLMQPLRRHLSRFAEKVFAKAEPGDVSVSIVPFSNSVAFPPEFDRWIDPNNGYSQADEFKGCFEHQSVFDTAVVDASNYANRIVTYDRRMQPRRKNIPFCPEERSYISFYHQDKQDLIEKVSKLTTSFGTNTSEGLTWARRILSPEWQDIFKQSKTFPRPYKSENNKVIILLTDGRPLQYPSIEGDGTANEEQEAGRERGLSDFKEVCKQIIDEGDVDLYTIVYGDIMSEDQRNEVRSCIAGSGLSFWASESSLENVFRKILAMNSELALSK